jgi:spermidine/putrescine transport system ATP-binding protein
LALFPHLSIFENVAFGLRVRKYPKERIASKVQSALALVHLDGYENRTPSQLSGGQRQRVAMARALINEPSVLLLDEPLGALDLQLRLQMHEELRRLQRAVGNTFIFVTHDQGEAMAMSDRIAIMNAGEIIQLGTPEEIYERPRTRFVAQFVGHANLFDGKICQIAGGQAVIDSRGVLLTAVSPGNLEVGQPVTLVLRYERLALSGGDNALTAPLVERMFLGATVRVVIELAGRRVTADLPATSCAGLPPIGSPLSLNFHANDARVLVT